MKKHEAMKFAYDNYPAGTKYKLYDTIRISEGKFQFCDYVIREENGLLIYNGSEWAEIIPDKMFIMTSEDGIDLYVNDNFYVSMLSRDKWKLDTHDCLGTIKEETKFIFRNDFVSAACYKQRDIYKVFSTKEAAEKWISKMNKPKQSTIKSFHGFNIKIHANGDIFIKDMTLRPSDLEDMLHAYKSLQS